VGRPIILADLDMEDEVGEVAGGEDQVGAERHGLARDVDLESGEAERPRRTSASRNIRGNWAGSSWAPRRGCAARDRQRAIIERPLRRSAAPTSSTGLERRAGLDDRGDAGFGRVEHRILQVQVVDRVGSDVELGKDEQVGALASPCCASAIAERGVGGGIADGRDGVQTPARIIPWRWSEKKGCGSLMRAYLVAGAAGCQPRNDQTRAEKIIRPAPRVLEHLGQLRSPTAKQPWLRPSLPCLAIMSGFEYQADGPRSRGRARCCWSGRARAGAASRRACRHNSRR
jgi:hypothetical protein